MDTEWSIYSGDRIYDSYGILDFSNPKLFLQNSCMVTICNDCNANPLHSHNYIQIFYIREGGVYHYFNGVEYKQYAGSLIVVPPFIDHFIDARLVDKYLSLRIDLSREYLVSNMDKENRNAFFDMMYFGPLATSAKLFSPMLSFEGEERAEIELLLASLLERSVRRDVLEYTQSKSELVRFLTMITDKYGESATPERASMIISHRRALSGALDYIEANYMNKLCLSDICKIALLSQSRFSIIFKSIMGVTCSEYISQLRVNRARSLLETTDRTMYDIRLACGFSSDRNFRRVFKELVHCRPVEYRNRNHIRNSEN